MKAITLFLFLSFFFFNACGEATSTTKSQQPVSQPEAELNSPEKLLRHVVLFNFTDTAPRDTIQKIEQLFAGLKDQIPAIHSFEWGTNNSPEGLDKGLTHCFLVTFRTESDRATYLPHPAHQAFVKFIGTYVEDVTVVDYWTQSENRH